MIATFIVFIMACFSYLAIKNTRTECSVTYQDAVFKFISDYSDDVFIGNEVKKMNESFILGDTESFYESYNNIAVIADSKVTGILGDGWKYVTVLDLLNDIA